MERGIPARPVRQHEHNLALVAELVARLGPVSRAGLARHSGLTKTTVTQLAGELLDGALLRELGTGRARGPGRPATDLVLNSLGPAGIGLQFEADHVAGCLVDLTGRVRDRAVRRADDLRGDPALAGRAAEVVLRRLLRTAETTGNVVAGVVAAVPGRIVDSSVVNSVELGWQDIDLACLLGDRLAVLGGGIAVSVYGSHQLAALAETWFGAATRQQPLLYVGGELGLGACVLTAATGVAAAKQSPGDLAHLRVRRGGPRCSCGGRGCLETVAGYRAMLRAAGSSTVATSRLCGGEGPLPGLLASGDPAAVAAARTAARALGRALGGPVALLEPGEVVLGGRLGALGEPFAEEVRAALAQCCPAAAARVRASQLGGDAVARAAAAVVTSGLLADPAGWLAQ
ncbi:transcriptional regulator/sugar kinase [Saccharomonospora marina XMU15]|uniref:Transcriptional regulator/sugar kinase n=1 Tax=Saccharomonospora marina XMU15 TaxID=882083 RepID=H5X8M6_9PSEU|nr:ROK family protein [Saccharomonospora marina]EHR51395.1 transcriptional regulator/sugar kinase [Saccharomonospora marina XMU15]